MNEKKPEIAYEILQYLIDNPNAEDTLEGIVAWWLLVRTIKERTLAVKQALEVLVDDGLVIAKKGRDGRNYYKINRLQRKRIISALEQRS